RAVVPRGGLTVVAALCCATACCWGVGATARGQSTLLQYLDERPLGAGQPAPTLLDSISTPERIVEQILPVDDASAIGAPPVDFATGPYGSGVVDDPSLMQPEMPINWISGPYLRYGVDFVMGDGMLEGGQKVSWGINGGYRQPLALGLAPPNMF